METKGQKFKKNSVVRIADDLGDSMSHFPKGKLAVVEYSYAEKYYGNDNKYYSLYVEGLGSVAWFYEHQLTLVSEDGADLLTQWEDAATKKREAESDWENVYDKNLPELPDNTVIHLWENVMGYGSIWGRNGEGFNALINGIIVQQAYSRCKDLGYGSEHLPQVISDEAGKIYKNLQ